MGGSPQTEVRQHNGLNQITRIQNGASQRNLSYDGVPGQSNGNLANDGTYAYTWDALNRLVQVNQAGGGFVAAYMYDALDRRIRKSLGATFTDCLYSGWQCVEDRDHSDGLIAQYVWGIYLDEILQMQTYAATGSQRLAAGTYYPLADLLYRTTALTDSSGNIVEAYDTDAYGNTLVFTAVGSTHSWWDPNAVQAAIPACPFIFTGQRFDAETSLYYYKRRVYSSALGRFLSRDPMGYASNLYEYVEGRPTDSTDAGGTAPSRDQTSDDGESGATVCDYRTVGAPPLQRVNPKLPGPIRTCTQRHENVHKKHLMDPNHPEYKCCRTLRRHTTPTRRRKLNSLKRITSG